MATSTLSSIIDITFNAIREFDTYGQELIINPDNLNIVMACVKNYYKLKIDMILGFETTVRHKIDKLNKLIPDINGKLRLLKIDSLNKDRICTDVVTMIIDRMEKINCELVPTIAPSVNIGEMLKLYQQVHEVELQLLNMCNTIKSSFTGPYESIIFEKIKDKMKQADQLINKMCAEERYDVTQPILMSYRDMGSCISDILKFVTDINIKSVQDHVSEKIRTFHETYHSVISRYDDLTGTELLLVLYNTTLKLKEKVVELNLDSNAIKRITDIYTTTEKSLKNRICNTFYKPISVTIDENVTKLGIKVECAKKICGILGTIDHCTVEKKTIELIWNAVINGVVSALVDAFMSFGSGIFETGFTEYANILIGELSSYIKKITKERFDTLIQERGIDAGTYTSNLFNRTTLIIKFAMCDGVTDEKTKKEFLAIYGDSQLYNNLCSLKSLKKKSTGKFTDAFHFKLGGKTHL